MNRNHKPSGGSFLPFVVMMIITSVVTAQVDQEFWFAPPEVNSAHGDSPIYLRISTLDLASTVTIVQPANKSFTPMVHTITANSSLTIDLTEQLDDLETRPANSVRKTGLYVSATTPVTAYYEEASYANAEIFVLKGKNGLGNQFMIPGQNSYNNHPDYPQAFSSFDIVATRDNTWVTITPTNSIVGHEKGIPFTIKLNKGETYSATNISQDVSFNLVGSRIESTKPIAITLKDDSLEAEGICADLTGDQLVPIKVTGTEYVITKGFLEVDEFAFVTALYDNTELFVGGDTSPIAMLLQGQLSRISIVDNLTYLTTTKPVFVNHVTGFGCELAMAILPALTCRGSTQISFTRSTDDFFGLNIVVPKSGINNFQLNGRSNLIPGNAFVPVPGTNDNWYAARLEFNVTDIPVGEGSIITNSTSSFQAGTINGEAHTSNRLGYFSSFSTLFIGDDFKICPNETDVLDAGPGKDSYEWSTGQTTQRIQVSEPGTYWVTTKNENCLLQDTIVIDAAKTDHTQLELGPDISICTNDSITLAIRENWTGSTYEWSTGETTPSIKVKDSGQYSATVASPNCLFRDTVNVSVHPAVPKPSITGPLTVCPNVDELDYATNRYDSLLYQWAIQGGQITDQTNPTGIKVDWGTASNDAFLELKLLNDFGCSEASRLNVKINSRLEPVIPSGVDTVCFNDRSGKIYSTNYSNGSVYTWQAAGGTIVDGQGTSTVAVNWHDTGLYELQVSEESITDTDVCSGQSPVFQVLIFKDSASFDFSFVTAAHEFTDNRSLNAFWSVRNPERLEKSIMWIRWKNSLDADFSDSLALPATVYEQEFTGSDFLTSIRDFQLSAIDLCGNHLTSSIHENIVLSTTVDTIKNSIILTWNEYEGWSTGVESYNLRAKLDTEDGESLVATLPQGRTLMVTVPSNTAFAHQYWVQAIGRRNEMSLSNKVNLKFDNPVWIPNVITPNDDGFNDRFTILNIHLYPKNTLIIYNRWGKVVFETSGYANTWDGDNLASGVYYFDLILYDAHVRYRGPLSVLR